MQERVRQFIWGGKSRHVRKKDIILTKQQSGLGLLPLQEQALTVFGNLVA
jgi:hypothetical protein